MKDIKYLVIHHSASSQNTPAETVNKWHKQRNWNTPDEPIYATASSLGWHGQYHYYIEGNGKVTQFRELDEIGWHAGDWAVNNESLAVCFAGNFMNDELTSAQIASFRDVWNKIRAWYPHLTKDDVRGHRDFKNTECPGDNIYLNMDTELFGEKKLTINFILSELSDEQREFAFECASNVIATISTEAGVDFNVTFSRRDDVIWNVTSGGVFTGIFNQLQNKAYINPYQIAKYGKADLTCLLFDQEVIAPKNPATPVHHPLIHNNTSPFQVPINDGADAWYVESTIFHELLHALYYLVNNKGVGLKDKTHSSAYQDSTNSYIDCIKEIKPYLELLTEDNMRYVIVGTEQYLLYDKLMIAFNIGDPQELETLKEQGLTGDPEHLRDINGYVQYPLVAKDRLKDIFGL